MNARTVEGHHAIKLLRGEEYFVVTHNLAASSSAEADAHGLIRRIAEAADGLEDRLSRGRGRLLDPSDRESGDIASM